MSPRPDTHPMTWPAYLGLMQSGELDRRVQRATKRLKRCVLCPRVCGVNRMADERGECRTGRRAVVSAAHLHFGEEEPLVGHGGSGTIFFAHCNLACRFCQNYEISQLGEGREVDAQQLANLMLELQRAGAHNINLVSPSHVIAQILEALALASRAGLRLPLVYNTGGYDSLASLHLLDGVVDIYMPDAKFADAQVGKRLSGVDYYPHINRHAIQAMHRQVGDLVVDDQGVAVRGLIVRHLVLPEGLSGTESVLRFLAEDVSRGTFVNVMDQYSPCYRAREIPELARPLTWREYQQALATARSLGLERLAR